MYIRLADINISIDIKYKYMFYLCQDYIIDKPNSIDITIKATDEEMQEELKAADDEFPEWYAEAIVCYRKICHELYRFNAIMIHGSAVEFDNKAYIFTALSGTGKTTHTELLKEYLKDKLTYINGDKPIIRKIDNDYYVYGTPWNGKEGYGENKKAKLSSIIFLERGMNNTVSDISNKEIIRKITEQVVLPNDAIESIKFLDILDDVLKSSKKYLLKCNMENDAPICTYENILLKG